MVFILKEKKARKIFEKYSNVCAFTLGKSKGIHDEELEIGYSKLSFIPDEDTLNGIVDGTVKAKKVIASAVKALHKPSTDPESYDICITMAQLTNILYPEGKKEVKKTKKRGPNVIVFVLDDYESDDKNARIKAKFLTKYLSALFGEFGIEVITDAKVVDKVFKGRKKKVAARVSTFVSNNKSVRMSDKGHILKKTLLVFFGIELRQRALKGVDPNRLSKATIKTLLTTLINTYTNDNLKVAQNAGKKKDIKKICKQLRSKNRLAVEAYESFEEILEAMNSEVKLPKVKNGYQKKGKHKGEPKMNVDKFIKFFTKKKAKNLYLLILLYAHSAAVMIGAEVGSSEYTKTMSNAIKAMGMDSDVSKSFTSAAKSLSKVTG